MALNFKAKTEEQIKKESNFLLEPGDYDFEVLVATEEVSDNGNPMLKLKLGVWRQDGKQQWVFDYLLESFPSKLRHFCDSVGLLSKYESGSLAAHDCNGRSGKCKIEIKKDKKGQYPDKNQVKDYISRPARPLVQKAEQAQSEAKSDDDIPF